MIESGAGYDRKLTEVLDFRRVLDELLLLGLRELVRLVVAPVLLPADQFPATGRHRDENVRAIGDKTHAHVTYTRKRVHALGERK